MMVLKRDDGSEARCRCRGEIVVLQEGEVFEGTG
jgi:hypothetical protein